MSCRHLLIIYESAVHFPDDASLALRYNPWMLKKTPLNAWHAKHQAKLVDFAGWEMPLNYGSQIEEHHAVREGVGIFDVSHMGVVDLEGEDATYYLRHLLANDVAKLTDGQALYSCMLNEQGGIKDDLIVYRFSPTHYRIVVNASMRESDVAWMKEQAERYDVWIELLPDFCIFAVQGPKAFAVIQDVLGQAVANQLTNKKPFHFISHEELTIARTGYTGEEGVEILVPSKKAEKLWINLIKAGAKPCGLGARDTLRLEAGLNLYGTDMDETVSPLVSNLAWTVSFKDPERNFIGKAALQAELKNGVQQQLIGLVLDEKGVLRNHQDVFYKGEKIGGITSGGFSPTLKQAIAFARLPKHYTHELSVERRGQFLPVTLVNLPFVRLGKNVMKKILPSP